MEDQKDTLKKETEGEAVTKGSEALNEPDGEEYPEDSSESAAEDAGTSKVPFEGSVLDHLERIIPWNVFFLGLGIVFLLLTIWNR